MRLVLGVPSSFTLFFSEFLSLGLAYLFFFLATRTAVLRVGFFFGHPFKGFVPPGLADSPELVAALERYSGSARLILAHGVASSSAFVVGVFIYLRTFPPLKSTSKYKFTWALGDSWRLQADKYHHLRGIDEVTRAEQWEVMESTFDLHDQLHRFIGSLAEEDVPGLNPTRGVLFVLLGLAFLARLGRSRAFALVISNFDGLPGWVVFKSAYPVVLTGPAGLVLLRWRRSGLSGSEYLGSTLFSPGTTAPTAAAQLDRFRWYTLLGAFGGTGVFLLNWVIVLAGFVSYRFPGLGAAALRENEPSFEVLFGEAARVPGGLEQAEFLRGRYGDLVDRVAALEEKLAVYYPDGVDPTGELWWLLLVRFVFSTALLVGVVFLSRRGRPTPPPRRRFP